MKWFRDLNKTRFNCIATYFLPYKWLFGKHEATDLPILNQQTSRFFDNLWDIRITFSFKFTISTALTYNCLKLRRHVLV